MKGKTGKEQNKITQFVIRENLKGANLARRLFFYEAEITIFSLFFEFPNWIRFMLLLFGFFSWLFKLFFDMIRIRILLKPFFKENPGMTLAEKDKAALYVADKLGKRQVSEHL